MQSSACPRSNVGSRTPEPNASFAPWPRTSACHCCLDRVALGRMTFGTSLLFVHVLLSLVGIGAGVVVTYGFLSGKHYAITTAVFLATTVLTSVTGFMFPVPRFLPSHVFGLLSLVALTNAIL